MVLTDVFFSVVNLLNAILEAVVGYLPLPHFRRQQHIEQV